MLLALDSPEQEGLAASGQGTQATAASASLQFIGTAASAQAGGTTAASGGQVFGGSAVTAQGVQTTVATAKLIFTGTLASAQGGQGSVGLGVVIPYFSGTIVSRQASQSTSASGSTGVDAAETGQGSQSTTATGTAEGGAAEWLDGVGLRRERANLTVPRAVFHDPYIDRYAFVTSAQGGSSSVGRGHVGPRAIEGQGASGQGDQGTKAFGWQEDQELFDLHAHLLSLEAA